MSEDPGSGSHADGGAHETGRARAEGLRRSLVEYLTAVHAAYVAAASQYGADPGSLPLAGAPFSVAVVAADQLHLLATRDELPPLRTHERPVAVDDPPLRWQVRFLDVSVLPELASTEPVERADVLRLLGVSASLYHLVVDLAGSLDGHQAMHAGAGLAHAHLTARP
jgi:hypothetical protein